MTESNATYAKNLLLLAAQRAENAGDAARGAIEELEGLLPPGQPRWSYVWNPETKTNDSSLNEPWTHKTALLHSSLTSMRSAASRSTKLAEELRRYAGIAGQHE